MGYLGLRVKDKLACLIHLVIVVCFDWYQRKWLINVFDDLKLYHEEGCSDNQVIQRNKEDSFAPINLDLSGLAKRAFDLWLKQCIHWMVASSEEFRWKAHNRDEGRIKLKQIFNHEMHLSERSDKWKHKLTRWSF